MDKQNNGNKLSEAIPTLDLGMTKIEIPTELYEKLLEQYENNDIFKEHGADAMLTYLLWSFVNG